MKSIIKNENELPIMLNRFDIPKALGISQKTADNLINSYGFPKIRIGRRIVIPRDAFLEWIKKSTQ